MYYLANNTTAYVLLWDKDLIPQACHIISLVYRCIDHISMHLIALCVVKYALMKSNLPLNKTVFINLKYKMHRFSFRFLNAFTMFITILPYVVKSHQMCDKANMSRLINQVMIEHPSKFWIFKGNWLIPSMNACATLYLLLFISYMMFEIHTCFDIEIF